MTDLEWAKKELRIAIGNYRRAAAKTGTPQEELDDCKAKIDRWKHVVGILIGSDRYWSRITDIYHRQREKGLKSYGCTLEDSTVLRDAEKTITYLQEELVDGLMYCEHLKVMLKEDKKGNV